MKYRTLSDLPHHIRKRILGLSQPDPEQWVLKTIPALGNQSIIETMNSEGGEVKIVDYIGRLEGYLS
jgi:hypothetical protein